MFLEGISQVSTMVWPTTSKDLTGLTNLEKKTKKTNQTNIFGIKVAYIFVPKFYHEKCKQYFLKMFYIPK